MTPPEWRGFCVEYQIRYAIIRTVMNMTKQEMIEELNELAAGFKERDLETMLTFAGYVAWRAEFPDEETQVRESEEDYERGDVVTLAEAKRELGLCGAYK